MKQTWLLQTTALNCVAFPQPQTKHFILISALLSAIEQFWPCVCDLKECRLNKGGGGGGWLSQGVTRDVRTLSGTACVEGVVLSRRQWRLNWHVRTGMLALAHTLADLMKLVDTLPWGVWGESHTHMHHSWGRVEQEGLTSGLASRHPSAEWRGNS